MAAFRFDKSAIFAKVNKAAADKSYPRAQMLARDIYTVEKQRLIEDFESHPVTEELVDHTNNSRYLDGARGTLFGFIGFEASSDPIQKVTNALEAIDMPTNPRQKRFKNLIQFVFPIINVPSESDYGKIAPFEGWGAGSWIHGIEKGIAGLVSYLAGNDELNSKYSRSKEGFQAKTFRGKTASVNPGKRFRTTSYLSVMLRRFRSRFSSTRN